MDAIIYLDDDKANLSAFHASYRQDFDIHCFEDPNEALEFLKDKEVKVVISDQRMPSISGVEFLKSVQEIDQEPMRILMTAYDEIGDIKAAINEGQIYYYVQKPFEHEEMKLLLQRAIGAFDLRKGNQDLRYKKEKEEKDKIQAVLHNLENQVNPHFLFNSLNMLYGLVEEDPKKAQAYILNLSAFLRKSLEMNKKDLATIEEEIQLLDHYFYIQKIRFGEGVKLEKEVSEDIFNRSIPIMGLQICVENAIKHNSTDPDKALEIEIYSDLSGIYVINSFQPKERLMESSGVGQKNLIERYKIFEQKLPFFRKESDKYICRLPYIKT